MFLKDLYRRELIFEEKIYSSSQAHVSGTWLGKLYWAACEAGLFLIISSVNL